MVASSLATTCRMRGIADGPWMEHSRVDANLPLNAKYQHSYATILIFFAQQSYYMFVFFLQLNFQYICII